MWRRGPSSRPSSRGTSRRSDIHQSSLRPESVPGVVTVPWSSPTEATRAGLEACGSRDARPQIPRFSDVVATVSPDPGVMERTNGKGLAMTTVKTPPAPPRIASTDSTDTPHAAPRVQWGPVAAFVALAYAVAWGVWIALYPHLTHFVGAAHTPTKFKAPASIVLGMYAPAISAVIMRMFLSKEGLRTSLGPIRHRRKYFAIAL